MVPILVSVGLVAGLLITPLLIRAAVARGLYDVPDGGRRIHSVPVPRIGGVAVYAATMLALGAAAWWNPASMAGDAEFYLGLLVAGSLLFTAGLVDDLRGLSPLAKVVAQLAAALVLYSSGFHIDVTAVGAMLGLPLGWLSLPLTVLWVVGVTNAINLIDGLDGLATGIALVALCSTVVVSLFLGTGRVLIVALALVGALLGFLRYNFSPARIFLGDSGSLFLGCMLAALSLPSGSKEPIAALGLVPPFALALPLLDTGLAVVRRWLRGVPFSAADRRHIHHQLLARGLTRRAAVLVLYAAAAALAGAGLLIGVPSPGAFSPIAATAAALVLVLSGLAYLRYHELGEAMRVVLRAPGSLRRVIRDQIYARDVAGMIAPAKSLVEINSLLRLHAPSFRFLAMEVCRETEPRLGRSGGSPAEARATWLEYPLVPAQWPERDSLVLRIWCPASEGFRPFGAERVAGILAPVVEQWFVQWRERELASPAPLSVVGSPMGAGLSA